MFTEDAILYQKEVWTIRRYNMVSELISLSVLSTEKEMMLHIMILRVSRSSKPYKPELWQCYHNMSKQLCDIQEEVTLFHYLKIKLCFLIQCLTNIFYHCLLFTTNAKLMSSLIISWISFSDRQIDLKWMKKKMLENWRTRLLKWLKKILYGIDKATICGHIFVIRRWLLLAEIK